MKATAEYIEREPEFKPIKVSFELESKEELANFYAIVGLTPPKYIYDNCDKADKYYNNLITCRGISELQWDMYQAIKSFIQENFNE